MANMIIVPLSGALDTNVLDEYATWYSDTGTLTAGTIVTGIDVLGGSGENAKISIFINGGTALTNVDGTITTAGEGYKVGDVIYVAADTSGGSKWTEPLAWTIVEGDLVGNEDTGIITAPTGGQFLCVVPATTGEGWNNPQILQIESGHERIWAITTTGGSATNYKSIATNINKVMKEAMQNPNSNPVLDLSSKVSGVAVSSVALT